jgi:hypothetical protein
MNSDMVRRREIPPRSLQLYKNYDNLPFIQRIRGRTLMAGKLPLLEVSFRTIPYISWRQIIIGDPLYTPFMKSPAIHLPERPDKHKGAEMTSPTDYE